jgi:hypothetical protein
MNNLRRVLIGTIVYAIILVLAAPYPSAAGSMLTFPALNGLGFLYVEQSKVSGMAASMLWMPILNGALCIAYIVVFLVLAPTVPAGALAWVLVFSIAVLWCALVRRSLIRDGIPRERQLIYAIGVTVVGAVFLLVAFFAVGSSRLPAVQTQDIGLAQAAWRTFLASWYKIALFAIAFATFLILSERLNLSDSARGILAGLPLVPFGGLVSIAASHGSSLGPGIGERIATFKGMAVGIWLGPAVAVWFIYAVSRYFDARRPLASAKTEAAMPDFLIRLGVVALGWIACGAVIAGIAWTVEFFT